MALTTSTTIRRSVPALGAAMLMAGGLAVGGAGVGAADPGGSGCQLAAVATFTPNGPGAAATFGYTLDGTLSACETNRDGAPAGGAIGVGQVVTESVPITLDDGTVVQGTADYQAPAATGSGTTPENSCLSNETSGTAIVEWEDSSHTVVDYTTQSLAAGVDLQGAVVDSVELTLVPGSEDPAGTAPNTITVSTDNPTYPVGDAAAGLVEFSSDDPAACTTEEGLATADVQGLVAVGSSS